jgi:hypothetical protein
MMLLLSNLIVSNCDMKGQIRDSADLSLIILHLLCKNVYIIVLI